MEDCRRRRVSAGGVAHWGLAPPLWWRLRGLRAYRGLFSGSQRPSVAVTEAPTTPRALNQTQLGSARRARVDSAVQDLRLGHNHWG